MPLPTLRTWPRPFTGLLRRNATAITLGTAGNIASLVAIALVCDPAALFSAQRDDQGKTAMASEAIVR